MSAPSTLPDRPVRAAPRADSGAHPAKTGFDDTVLLARALLGAPASFLGLVDGDGLAVAARLGIAAPDGRALARLLSRGGLDRGGGVRQGQVLPHGDIFRDDLCVLPDLRVLADRGAGPGGGALPFGFLAALRLVSRDGVPLGTLCVLDTLPRAGLAPGQEAAFRALGRRTVGLLESRAALDRREARLARQRQALAARAATTVRLGESALLMRLAIEATEIGIWDYDPLADRLDCDAHARRLLGLDAAQPANLARTFLRAIHPDDRMRAAADLRTALDPEGDGRFGGDYRLARPDDAPFWVAICGRPVLAGGRANRIVGSVRDVTARKVADLASEAVRERYRLIARATSDAIRDWDLVADTVTWNEALQTAYGWAPDGEAATGAWWLAQVHPADRDRVEAALGTAIRGGSDAWSLEYRFLRADGRHADVLDRGYVIRDADGTPVRMVGAMLDLSERNRAEADVRAIFEGANVGIVQLDPHSLEVLSVNAKLCAIWGAPAAAIVGRSVALWTPQEDAAERDTLHRRLAAGEVLRETLEKRYRRADGRIIWARVNLVSQALGDRLQTTAMIEDITLERTTEARHRALIALGDALRDASGRTEAIGAAAAILGATLPATRAGYGAVDVAGGVFQVEAAWTAADADPAGPPPPCPLAAFPETLARLASGLPQAIPDIADPALTGDAAAYAGMGARAAINVPLTRLGRLAGVLFVHDRAPRAWAAGEIAFVREVAERLWGTLGRIQAEDQQALRNRELSHRLKNTLAMVQAIASQTLRNAPDFESAKEALAARLIALGKAHDILLTGARESAGIAAVIAGALAIHDDGQAGRLALDGPEIEVGPKAALSLALMMHELATNAAKYGALSVPGGRVAVTWSLDADAMVRMLWTERGGPKVAPPTRKGFGSRLIERGLAGAVGGAVGLAYEPDGVVCRVEAPLSGFQAVE
ncbi:PAS domain-containing protein [Methylobacterium sp. J-092]|uniref:PAS domain-containing sensor histidine kinase n=1 Tax=Methylobacterium sp. J-092 TaxID=2836667 RepID=UPI001FB9F8A3|nr:PAS domain-containing protein [Methylobacterium sp. J-092]MCJ2007778.1 PAS domain-containing protein [Methylobacterium sp. J-092]